MKTTGKPDNEISTFWQQADIDLSRGLDFADKEGIVYARVTHLQHAPFEYNITVRNICSTISVSVRISSKNEYSFVLAYQKYVKKRKIVKITKFDRIFVLFE